jgi:endo-1,4-beta-xylanase
MGRQNEFRLPFWTRRGFVVSAVGAGLASFATAAPANEPDSAPGSLKTKAAKRGLLFGSGVSAAQIRDDAFAAAVVADCALIVPVVEMKWGVVERRKGALDFAAADAIVAFARDNGLEIRGHAAIWHQNIPAWLPTALAAADGEDVFERHIRDVLGHFGDAPTSWDVVNEAIEPKDGLPSALRNSIFYGTLGADYVTRAFRVARATLPHMPLYYNDFGLEYDFQSPKRAATLALLAVLRKQGLIDGLGVQSHLKVGLGFDAKAFRRFIADVADLGLSILLTEFDVNDTRTPADESTRDQMIADHAQRYLDVALDEKMVKGLVAWGLSDRYTWLNASQIARADGLSNRGQPLDAALARKPLWRAIAQALDGAPTRDP